MESKRLIIATVALGLTMIFNERLSDNWLTVVAPIGWLLAVIGIGSLIRDYIKQRQERRGY